MLYTCDSCGSSMVYDPESKKLVCQHCGNTRAAMPEQKEWDGRTCPSCGAPLDGAQRALVWKCPYCGVWIGIDKNMAAADAPKKIRPFSYGKKKAREKILDAFDNIPFLPKEFLADPEGKDIEAVYVPFWIYHTLAIGDYEYEAEKRVEGVGETIVSVYHLERNFAGRYNHVPVDAKDDLDDNVIDASIDSEDRDTADFDPIYLAGAAASLPDKPADSEEYKKRAEDWTRESAESETRDFTKDYSSARRTKDTLQVSVLGGETDQVLLPVYRYIYKGSGQHKIYLDGTTGRMSGDAPCDRKKVVLHYLVEMVCAAVTTISVIGLIGVLL